MKRYVITYERPVPFSRNDDPYLELGAFELVYLSEKTARSIFEFLSKDKDVVGLKFREEEI